MSSDRDAAVRELTASRRLRAPELLPWLIAIAVYFFLPQYLQLGTQILEMILFTLSLDLLIGYTGIVTLGHAAYYGAGAYTAGLIAVGGWTEPLTGLLAATVAAGALGLITGAVILRTSGLALLMLGMAVTLLLGELANNLNNITGGADGLQGVSIAPVFGAFRFDMFGHTAFLYALCVLLCACAFTRQLVVGPFGRSLFGIRQNARRMEAIGVAVWQRKLAVFTISASLAGLAGGLACQTNQFVTLEVFSFELSGTVILMLILGGAGRLYGAFIGATVYMLAQDTLAKQDPVLWQFWLGIFVIALVLFARGGALGIIDTVSHLLFRRKLA